MTADGVRTFKLLDTGARTLVRSEPLQVSLPHYVLPVNDDVYSNCMITFQERRSQQTAERRTIHERAEVGAIERIQVI